VTAISFTFCKQISSAREDRGKEDPRARKPKKGDTVKRWSADVAAGTSKPGTQTQQVRCERLAASIRKEVPKKERHGGKRSENPKAIGIRTVVRGKGQDGVVQKAAEAEEGEIVPSPLQGDHAPQ